MLENFSKSFESAFRVVFIVWVSFWGILNISSLLLQYANFASLETNGNVLASWWLNTLAVVVTVTVGVFLFIFMVNVPTAIRKSKKIGSLGTMTALAVVYYLFITIVNIFTSAIFKPETFARDFVFLSAWLFPSIILLIVHILYINNLGKYNQELETVNQKA